MGMTEEEVADFARSLTAGPCVNHPDRPASSGSSRGECPECFRARLRSVRLDPSVTETRTRRRYYDSHAMDQMLGADRSERYWEDTGGEGAMHRQDDGSFVHTNFRGETEVLGPREVGEWLVKDAPEIDPNQINDTGPPQYPGPYTE